MTLPPPIHESDCSFTPTSHRKSFHDAAPTPSSQQTSVMMHPISIPGRRSFSLHDLDTRYSLKLRSAHASGTTPCAPSATSLTSSDTNLPPDLIYPLHPLYPPPDRKPTPPGLPRFGSKEAQLYRLVPSSSVHGFAAWGRRSARLKGKGQENNSDPSVLRVAPVVGPLARAEDGTWIRGRFPVRGSGHGVGACGRRCRARTGIDNGGSGSRAGGSLLREEEGMWSASARGLGGSASGDGSGVLSSFSLSPSSPVSVSARLAPPML